MAAGQNCFSVLIIVVLLALFLREVEGCYCPWGSWSSTSGCPGFVHQCACRDPLGMESGAIPDSRITASSYFTMAYPPNDLMHAPYRGRLNGVAGVGAWVAQSNYIGQWLQVDLGATKRVSGVIIQGRYLNLAQWVTSYQLRYKADGSSWTTYADIHGQTTILSGIRDSHTPVTNLLDNAIYARYVRFVAYSWVNWISMRVEILGCNYDGSQTRTRNPCCQPSIETRRVDCWDCSWSSWSSWSTCSGGSQSRRRYRGTCCSQPHEDTRTQLCNMNMYTCEWGTWQSWTTCLPPCGAGRQTRTRYRESSCNPNHEEDTRSCYNSCDDGSSNTNVNGDSATSFFSTPGGIILALAIAAAVLGCIVACCCLCNCKHNSVHAFTCST